MINMYIVVSKNPLTEFKKRTRSINAPLPSIETVTGLNDCK